MDQPFFCRSCGHSIELDPSLLQFNSVKDVPVLAPFMADDIREKGKLSQRLLVANKIMKLVSTMSSEQPTCDDCAQELEKSLEQRLKQLNQECQEFDSYLNKLETESTQTKGNLTATTNRKLENQLVLDELKQESLALDLEINEIEKEIKELHMQAEQYFDRINQVEIEFMEQQDEMLTMNRETANQKELLEMLQKSNCYFDCFRIWHDGPFGTINGLRLGRLPGIPIEWDEINSALGEVVFLLEVLANKISFKFSDCKLYPFGMYSKIEKKEQSLELYGSSDLTGFFSNRRFDNGLVALVSCLAELGEYAEQKDTRHKLPYKISEDMIGDCSVKYGTQSNELWTKAMKYMLIDAKWMLAFCCT